MENIKLVIWDLDETFWKGTLSDGEVFPVAENIKLVRDLTDRGIINSICSKNDFDRARAELSGKKFGSVWEYFVFPSIDWTGKGHRVDTIIRSMNLRPVNCLFVDDSLNNLNEARFINPELQIVTPGELRTLMENEAAAFRGKDDTAHTRLNQYKILERKTAEKSRAGSNEEFLIQSEIKVEMIERDLPLDRIHEMIHRNNQLNFTKDRISPEEVKAVFTDPAVRSGVVHVTDKYGDHGIVGCYAVRDNRLLQFVFSCRILGMGVEQYVYQELGWPDITVVGEVASKLVRGETVSYINAVPGGADAAASREAGGGQRETDASDSASKAGLLPEQKIPGRLLVYGYCPLRPIWSYIEHKFEKATFHLISPMPPVCNLGVMFHTERAQLEEYLKVANTLNLNTFDSDLQNGKVDYLLISFINELQCCKYTFRKDSSRYFYSSRIENFKNRNWKEQNISPEDLYHEISVLASGLGNAVTIFILISPEVVFESKGRNIDYEQRIKSNLIAEKLAAQYSNIRLVDIRKYARYESDFFEKVVNHYNREIGYACAKEITEMITGRFSESRGAVKASSGAEKIPTGAGRRAVKNSLNADIRYTVYIRNSELYFEVRCDELQGVSFAYRVYCDRYEVCRVNSDKNSLTMNLSVPGEYSVSASIIRKGRSICSFSTGKINYSEFNYIRYIDPEAPNYDFCINSIDQFWMKNSRNREHYSRIIQQLQELSAKGVSIGDYFKEHKIKNISVFFDNGDVGRALISNLCISGIKIRSIFTTDSVNSIYVPALSKSFQVSDINDELPLNKSSSLLICPVHYQRPYVNKLSRTGARCHYLEYILSVLMTRTFFPKLNSRLVIAVQTCGYIPHFFAIKREEAILLQEKKHYTFTNARARQLLSRNNLAPFADYIRNSNIPKLVETLRKPDTVDIGDRQILRDCHGKYLNIENGFRKTVGTPSEYTGTIYIVGNCLSFGAGCSDDETIASCLQKIISLPYRVVNYSNFVWDDWNRALELLSNTVFTENDIVVLLLPNKILPKEPQLMHWINYDGMPDPVVKLDALPLFYRKDRPVYFQLPNAYSPECNQALAELINETIHKYQREHNNQDTHTGAAECGTKKGSFSKLLKRVCSFLGK